MIENRTSGIADQFAGCFVVSNRTRQVPETIMTRNRFFFTSVTIGKQVKKKEVDKGGRHMRRLRFSLTTLIESAARLSAGDIFRGDVSVNKPSTYR